ncbi:Uncharacterized protein HZ326_9795 [Fusarium oxysporum f. sp. albedinis]|nr:Uncharacterized protein HZ326_9795 [Fusarium oxysporum f. sp. albedinis]
MRQPEIGWYESAVGSDTFLPVLAAVAYDIVLLKRHGNANSGHPLLFHAYKWFWLFLSRESIMALPLMFALEPASLDLCCMMTTASKSGSGGAWIKREFWTKVSFDQVLRYFEYSKAWCPYSNRNLLNLSSMPQAQRISSALWEAQRSRITELYVNQDKTLDEVIQIMAETNFHATKPQYIRKVNVNWKLQKNYTKEKWRHAGVLVEKRQAEGKLTELSIDGKVISEKRRKKELRRYHALQVGENCMCHVLGFRHLLIRCVYQVASTNTCGVVAPTPPSSNSKVVLISHLPWLNFRESFNNLINDRHPLFNPNQQDGSVNFWEVANPLLRIAHNDGEMTIGNLALQEPPKPATDLVSMNLEITQQRLHELMPTLSDSINSF